ncbi:ABC transporter substrate-binding protein [Bacillota bacterium LX-D]|nr:ABC transporter substrate-binding protein [Bacillota bacterium LX-D]
MNKVDKFLQLICLLLVSIMLFGCFSNDKAIEEKMLEQKNIINNGLAINLPTDLSSLDPVQLDTPWDIELASTIYEGLVKYDLDTEKVVPALAASWKISPDGKTFTFSLRKNARFHTGKKVTAGDVKFSWERALSLNNSEINQIFGKIDGAMEFAQGKGTEVSGIKVVNDRVLQVDLNAADESFLLKLTHLAASIVNKDLVAEQGNLYGKPEAGEKLKIAGTGPYRLVEWVLGQSITLESSPYYPEKPSMPRLTFKFEPEKDIALSELERGDIQILQSEEIIPELFLRKDPELKKLEKKEPRSEIIFLGFNTLESPFDDPNFRQAINNALNRNEIAKLGNYLPAQGLLPRVLLDGMKPLEPYKYDAQKSKKYFSELTKKAKNPKALNLYFCNIGKNEQIAVTIKKQLQKAGLELRTQPIASLEELRRGIEQNRIDFYLDSFFLQIPDPEVFYRSMFLSSSPDNLTHYNNINFDELLSFIQTQKIGSKERNDALIQAEKNIMEDATIITILEGANYAIFGANIAKPELNPFKVISLENVSFQGIE